MCILGVGVMRARCMCLVFFFVGYMGKLFIPILERCHVENEWMV